MISRYLTIERSTGQKVRIKKYKIDFNSKTMIITLDGRNWKRDKEWDNDKVWLENLKQFFLEHKKIDPEVIPMIKYSVQQAGSVCVKLPEEFVDEWKFRKMSCSSGSIHHSYQW
jgi:hypothetical protein